MFHVSSKHKNILFTLLAFVWCTAFGVVTFISVEGTQWDNLRETAAAITVDEFSHISMAFYYLHTGTYFLNPEHPPLIKDIAAIGGLFIHPTLPDITLSDVSDALLKQYPLKTDDFPRRHELGNDQLVWGRLFLLNPDNDADEIAFWTRLPIIIANSCFFFLLSLLVARIWGKRAALLSLSLLLLSPLTIAHSALVTMDVLSSTLEILTLVVFSIFLRVLLSENREWHWFIGVILLFSLALLSKFSALLLFPILFIGGVIFIITQTSSWKLLWAFAWRYALLFGAVIGIVSGVYAFHIRHMSAADIDAQITVSYPADFSPQGLDCMRLLNAHTLTRPLAEYANGVTNVFGQLANAPQRIYFLGHVYGSEGAGPTYFPIMYATKLPIGLLALNALALLLVLVRFATASGTLRERWQRWTSNPLSLFLFLFCYGYAVTALSSTFQIGIRHIFPIIFGVTLLTARSLCQSWDWHFRNIPIIKIGTFIGLAFMCSFAIRTFPASLSAYNAFGGGTTNGYEIATDSNYDWGQDVNKLGPWVAEHHITTLYSDLFTSIPTEYYLGKINQGYNILSGTLPPSGSYLAVSIDRYMANRFDTTLPPNKSYDQLAEAIVDHVGTTILIFKIP
jgi:hypothetical protein